VGVELKAGSRFRSATGEAEVIVVRAPAGDVDLRIGGHPAVPLDDEAPSGLAVEAGFEGDLLIGKRYTDATGDLELLCTKAGSGSLSLGDDVLTLKDAKPLPSSD
jgi:hypothetical protein